MTDVQPIVPPHGLTAFEAFRRLGFVPVVRGGAETATEAGQGEGDGGNGLYQEALSTVPAELHPYVTEQFKKWDANVTPKLQEAARLKEQFGPLAQIDGLAGVDPQELQGLLELREVMQDPQQLAELIQSWSQSLEQLGVPTLTEEAWQGLGERNGWFDGEPAADQGTDAQTIAAQVMEQLRGELDPLKQFVGTQQQERERVAAQQELQQRMAALEGEHGELDDEARGAVIELAHAYVNDDDPLGKAFERYLQITGRVEGAAIDGKLNQPNGALSGGRPDTSPPALSWNGNGNDPKTAALARLKQT